MIGSLGDDLYKDKIIKELEEFGVNPMFGVLKADKTSRCCVCIYQKEKLFATQIRASKRLSEEFIEQHLEEILSHKALFIEGYMVSNKFNICKKLSEHFINDKKLIILSLSACFIVKFHYNKLIELANDADIIAWNLEEAKEFSGGKTDDIEEVFINIFEKLKQKEDRLIVITDGPKEVNSLGFVGEYFPHSKTCSGLAYTYDNKYLISTGYDSFTMGYMGNPEPNEKPKVVREPDMINNNNVNINNERNVESIKN